jgi:fructokinase
MRIGVDLGGTKIEAILIDDEGKEVARVRIATPKDDAQAIVAAVASLVKNLEIRYGANATVGVGTPGAISPSTGFLKNSNTICLNGWPIDRMLREALGREVRVANDANCFALSEAIDGSAADGRTMFGVILGTGVGGGVVVDRRLLVGPNAIAGEWGHNPLPWPKPDEEPTSCYCGKRGCIETYLSGSAMKRDHLHRTGVELDAETIAAESDNADAMKTLERYADKLARALASIINVIDPDVIVLGGGLSNIEALYRLVPERWSEHVFSDAVRTKLRPPHWGDSSGVRGAAWLWP